MPHKEKHMNRKDILSPEEDAVHRGMVTNVKSATQSFNSSILETIRNHKLSKQSKIIKIFHNHIITCFIVSNLLKATQTLKAYFQIEQSKRYISVIKKKKVTFEQSHFLCTFMN